MKNILKLVIFSVAALFVQTGSVAADDDVVEQYYTSQTVVTKLELSPATGYARVTTSNMQVVKPGGDKVKGNCTNDHFFYLDMNQLHSKAAWAMLLTAKISKSKVQLYLTSECKDHGTYEIKFVRVI